MNGLIISASNYTYEGNIVDGESHGKGIFYYNNGDRYVGECKYGKPDGFGTYYYLSGSKYTGFFSYGKSNGVGTFEDYRNIYKGQWRNDKKHGMFYKTNKIDFTTHMQKWLKGKLMHSTQIQYIQPDALQTIKDNPIKIPKKFQITFKGVEKKCMGCYNMPINATNIACGHVSMCEECLLKCDRCPICRAPILKVLKLFIS